MNAIAAIGSPAFFRVVDAYRAHAPSAIWVLGMKTPRDANDPLLRSLEALLEPFMTSFFAGEAQALSVAAVADIAAQSALPAAEQQQLSAVVCDLTGAELAPALSLVEMLDRAHALEPLDLVLSDGSTLLARAAIAWAHARGIAAVTVPAAAPLHAPPLPGPGRTVVAGERAANAYRAAGFGTSRLSVVTLADVAAAVVAPAERSALRTGARAAFSASLGWAAEDLVLVFEPPASERESAFEPQAAFAASLAAMFAGFAVARANVPGLRLALIAAPLADGVALAGEAAAAAGIRTGDFAYATADRDVWIAGADIVVGVDSPILLDGARLGIPAVNVWRAANWERGAAFAAEDGVIDVPPAALGATLAALASNAGLREQIGAIAAQRMAFEAPGGSAASAAIAAELARIADRLRPPRRTAPKPKPDIVIWAPDYTHASGGIRALFRLCHLINMAGGNASMHAPNVLHPTWNAPRRDTPITERTIVVVPEIVFGHPSLKRVVRWVLNKPGLLGGPSTYGPDEMVFYYAPCWQAAAQAATTEIITEERELDVFTTEPELFYNDRSRPRLYDCVYVGKGEATYAKLRNREMRDALVIKRDQTGVWPENRTDTAALLRGCRRLYSYDRNTAIVVEALICGAEAFYVHENGEIERVIADVSDYIERYYNLAYAERFLRLIGDRWN